MAHIEFLGKMSRLNARKRALRDKSQEPDKPVHSFRYAETLAPFLDYFYNAEKVMLLTNNFESNEPRNSKSAQYFHDEDELNEFIEQLTDYSSNDEDRPVASDEPFVDSDNYDVYDRLILKTGFIPPLTVRQVELLGNVSVYEIEDGDSPQQIERKKAQRMEFIRGYCKELKRKRYAKTYRRFTNVREKRLGVGLESMALLERETQDKHLNDPRSDEPAAFRKVIQIIRKLALKRKYLQYVTDPDYRQSYRERIFYNVNLDVPNEHRNDSHSQVFILDRNTADQANQTLNNTTLRKVPNLYNDARKDGDLKKEGFVLDASAVDEPPPEAPPPSDESIGVPLASSTLKDSSLRPETSTTESKVTVKTFADPLTPNAVIRLEKAVVTQSRKAGTDRPSATSTTTHVSVQKTDPDGNVKTKEFSFTHDEDQGQSIQDAQEAVGQPICQDEEDLPMGSHYQSPRILQWLLRHISKPAAVEGLKE